MKAWVDPEGFKKGSQLLLCWVKKDNTFLQATDIYNEQKIRKILIEALSYLPL